MWVDENKEWREEADEELLEPKLKGYSIVKKDIELESFVDGIAMKIDYERRCSVVGRESWRWYCGKWHLEEGRQQG
jgi:hypothetical protein